MSDPAVVARNLGYVVDGNTLVAGVDLDVSFGELVAVIGPNGAGKTTLLGLVAGDLRATTGTVALVGQSVAAARRTELARRRAVLSQRLSAEIPFTVGEVVAMGRFPHRSDPANSGERDRRAIGDALGVTDTDRFAARVYATLSGGERTRVALARVLAQETPVVLLDEPTTALDLANQQRVMRVIEHLARSGRAVLAVMHDLSAAAAHADRLVLMHRGRVVASGGPWEVLDGGVLSAVYGEPMTVVPHPFRDIPLVLPGVVGSAPSS